MITEEGSDGADPAALISTERFNRWRLMGRHNYYRRITATYSNLGCFIKRKRAAAAPGQLKKTETVGKQHPPARPGAQWDGRDREPCFKGAEAQAGSRRGQGPSQEARVNTEDRLIRENWDFFFSHPILI